jgi:negative regulator of sigma E activity
MSIRRAAPAALALAALLTGAAQRTDPAQLLRQAVDAYGKLSYVGQIQNVDFGSSHANAVLFRIEHRAPDFTRRWYLAPDSLYGDSIVIRGSMEYDVDVHKSRIVVARNNAIDDQVALDDNFGMLLRNYKAVMGPDTSVAGRRAVQVLLVNKYTGETVIRLALDAETKLVLEKDRFGSNGTVTNQMRFEQIRYTAVPPQVFDVPSGFTHVRGQDEGIPSNDLQALVKSAGFRALGPKYLPEGFLPIAGEVNTVKGVRTLHLLYSDGLRTISLFENARGAAVDMSHYAAHATKMQSNDAQYVQDGAMTLLAWNKGGLYFALVGELSLTELTRIGGSV